MKVGLVLGVVVVGLLLLWLALDLGGIAHPEVSGRARGTGEEVSRSIEARPGNSFGGDGVRLPMGEKGEESKAIQVVVVGYEGFGVEAIPLAGAAVKLLRPGHSEDGSSLGFLDAEGRSSIEVPSDAGFALTVSLNNREVKREFPVEAVEELVVGQELYFRVDPLESTILVRVFSKDGSALPKLLAGQSPRAIGEGGFAAPEFHDVYDLGAADGTGQVLSASWEYRGPRRTYVFISTETGCVLESRDLTTLLSPLGTTTVDFWLEAQHLPTRKLVGVQWPDRDISRAFDTFTLWVISVDGVIQVRLGGRGDAVIPVDLPQSVAERCRLLVRGQGCAATMRQFTWLIACEDEVVRIPLEHSAKVWFPVAQSAPEKLADEADPEATGLVADGVFTIGIPVRVDANGGRYLEDELGDACREVLWGGSQFLCDVKPAEEGYLRLTWSFAEMADTLVHFISREVPGRRVKIVARSAGRIIGVQHPITDFGQRALVTRMMLPEGQITFELKADDGWQAAGTAFRSGGGPLIVQVQ